MIATVRPVVVAVLAAITLAGCASNGHDTVRPRASASAETQVHEEQAAEAVAGTPSCPAAASSEVHWPAGVPADLPMLAGARIDSTATVSGTLQVQFTVPMSFKQAVKELLSALPSHGFTLSGGDAEADEVDIPFVRGSSQYNVKLHATADQCSAKGRLVAQVSP